MEYAYLNGIKHRLFYFAQSIESKVKKLASYR